MRRLLIALTLWAAGPALAEPLPQGDFMLAGQPWPDTALPRYLGLRVAGDRLALIYSSPLPLDHVRCERGDGCVYSVTGATATAVLDHGRVVLTDTAIDSAAPLDPGLTAPAELVYVAPMLDAIDGATLTVTAGGFALDTGGGALAFWALDPAAQAQLQALPVFYQVSIAALGGCEVAAMARLVQSAAPTPGEARFRAALASIAHEQAIRNRAQELDATRPAPGSVGDEMRGQLRRIAILPAILALDDVAEGQTLAEAGWAGMARDVFDGNRDAYDLAFAQYGAGLPDHVALLRHLRDSAPAVTPAAVCADLSLGFIAASG